VSGVFVELCAGSAAVSLRAMRGTARPPLGYQGGKRGYARAILAALGLQPGECRDWRFVWVEAGPWAEAWQVWRTDEGRADTIARLRAWEGEDPRALWERLRTAPVPTEQRERVAVWAVLQHFSYGRKPIVVTGGWRTHGITPDAGTIQEFRGPEPFDLRFLLRHLTALPSLSRVEVIHGDVRAVEPTPGAVVLIDPPYADTTGYGASLPRADALALAERWRLAGCTVAVCEQEPLPLPGWHHVELGRSDGIKRTFSRQQREVLTISEEPRGQLQLLGGVA
jgi:hypothetical protein